MPAYTIHVADLERDRALILELWRGNLGQEARMARKYDWFYRDCPFGAPLVLLLRHEASGAWVGVASAGPRRMWLDGRELLAGVLVDLAVLPEHRSLGPALMLQMALMEAGLHRFELLYGFPNPKATAVFKRVGYAPLGELVRHARVLRHGDYLRQRLPAALAVPAGALVDLADRLRLAMRGGGLRTRWSDDAGDVPTALWDSALAGPGPVAVRDTAFLRWRFDASPLVEVRHLLVSDGEGRCVAWFACEARERALHVLDGWVVEGAGGPGRAVLAALLRAARAAGHASVSVELGGAALTPGWRTAGFVPRQSRPVFGRTRMGDTAALRERIWLMSADEDE